MPHAELRYSADLALDAGGILAGIEAILQRHDAGSGDCKGRAYPAAQAHHRHLMVVVTMLPKAHRDAAFMAALRRDIFDYLKDAVPRPAWLSLEVGFSGEGYLTEWLEPS